MFTWICQKCGSEVPPSENDCPNCRVRTVPPPKSDVLNAERPDIEKAAPVAPPLPPPPAPPFVPPSAPARSEPSPAVYSAPAPPSPPARTYSPVAVAAGTAGVILAILAVLYLFVLPRGPAVSKVAMEAPGGPGSATPQHPLAKYLEITGVRIVEGSRGQAKISYVVVNHSPADLPDLKAQITLSAGDKEFFDFPVTIPSVGPYESKDLSTSLKTDLKPYELPDWAMLKTAARILPEP